MSVRKNYNFFDCTDLQFNPFFCIETAGQLAQFTTQCNAVSKWFDVFILNKPKLAFYADFLKMAAVKNRGKNSYLQ